MGVTEKQSHSTTTTSRSRAVNSRVARWTYLTKYGITVFFIKLGFSYCQASRPVTVRWCDMTYLLLTRDLALRTKPKYRNFLVALIIFTDLTPLRPRREGGTAGLPSDLTIISYLSESRVGTTQRGKMKRKECLLRIPP